MNFPRHFSQEGTAVSRNINSYAIIFTLGGIRTEISSFNKTNLEKYHTIFVACRH